MREACSLIWCKDQAGVLALEVTTSWWPTKHIDRDTNG
jgi:hypothetical protein